MRKTKTISKLINLLCGVMFFLSLPVGISFSLMHWFQTSLYFTICFVFIQYVIIFYLFRTHKIELIV